MVNRIYRPVDAIAGMLDVADHPDVAWGGSVRVCGWVCCVCARVYAVSTRVRGECLCVCVLGFVRAWACVCVCVRACECGARVWKKRKARCPSMP